MGFELQYNIVMNEGNVTTVMDAKNNLPPPQKVELFKGKEGRGCINLVNAPIQLANNEGMVFVHNGFRYGDPYPEYAPGGHQAYDAFLTHDENIFGDNEGSLYNVVRRVNQSTWNTNSFGLTVVNCNGANNKRLKFIYFLNPPKSGEGVLYNIPKLLPEQELILEQELLQFFRNLNDGFNSNQVNSVGMPVLVRKTQPSSIFLKALLEFANSTGFKSDVDIYLPEGAEFDNLVKTAKQYGKKA